VVVPGQVEIRLFATARAAAGAGHLAWPVPKEGISLSEIVEGLGRRYRGLRPILPTCRLFVNGELVRTPARRRLHDRDEVAVHPPYSGG
jgi:molybdopterin converting factor small subunit